MKKFTNQIYSIKTNVFWGLLVSTLFFIILAKCVSKEEEESKIKAIPIALKIDRFDIKFQRSQAEHITQLKADYPFLFPNEFDDEVWIARQKDTLQLLIQDAVEAHFSDVEVLEKSLTHLFQHILYFFPNTKVPRIIGLTNNVDYQIKIVYADSLLLLSLDTFLGHNHPLYEGIPNYIRKEMDGIYILSQVVEKFSTSFLKVPKDRTFLAQIIWHGKKLYMQDILNTHQEDFIKIGYTSEELQWAENNEKLIWQYFIEKQMLYSTEPDLMRRFIMPAPFSKFYLEIDNESPGRIGVWVGWQIVRAYMKRFPNTIITDLFDLSPQKLFQMSGYKPKR